MLGSQGRNLLAPGSTTPSENQQVCVVSSALPGEVEAVEELSVWVVDPELCVTAARCSGAAPA